MTLNVAGDDVLSTPSPQSNQPARFGCHCLGNFLDSNLHSQSRRFIELRMAHADLDALIDRTSEENPLDELMMRRLKKRRLLMRDELARIERELTPNEPA